MNEIETYRQAAKLQCIAASWLFAAKARRRARLAVIDAQLLLWAAAGFLGAQGPVELRPAGRPARLPC
jgi:hypothetical protein